MGSNAESMPVTRPSPRCAMLAIGAIAFLTGCGPLGRLLSADAPTRTRSIPGETAPTRLRRRGEVLPWDARIPRDDPKECKGGSLGRTPALLPVSQRVNADSQCRRELLLGQIDEAAERHDVLPHHVPIIFSVSPATDRIEGKPSSLSAPPLPGRSSPGSSPTASRGRGRGRRRARGLRRSGPRGGRATSRPLRRP